MHTMSGKKPKLTTWQYVSAIASVGKESFSIAPSAGIVRLFDSIIQAALPIATTYFAALATSALAEAYAGDETAAKNVFLYVFITSAISVVMLLWNSVSNYIGQKTRYKVEATVEDNMLRHFMSLPFAMYDDKDVIDQHEKAKRFSRFFSYIFDTIGQMFVSIFSGIGALLALIFVSPWLALVVFIAVLPGVMIQIRLARAQAQHWEGNITNRRRRYNIGWMLGESRYIAEMRVYGVAKKLIHMHGRLRDVDEKERLQLELRTIWKQLVADVVEALVELGALLWIVMQIIDKAQPVGQFLFVQQMVGRALGQAGSLARQLGQVDEDLANIVDYRNFMNIQPEHERTEALQQGTPEDIAIDSVSFTYPKTDVAVLKDVSLRIHKGEHVAIVGENGAGKSTLMKLLMGLYTPTSGEIRIGLQQLRDVSLEDWHRNIALLSQDFVSYHFATIAENIQLGDVTKKDDNAALLRAMHQAEFGSVVSKLEHGTNTYIERWMADDHDTTTATELSGGQYQRLALARNFYRDAPIVVLDEPTSAIDAMAEAKIFNRLFASDKTIIAISHRLSTVQKADVIYMMKDGKIAEHGTYDQLLAANGPFVEMFASQIPGNKKAQK